MSWLPVAPVAAANRTQRTVGRACLAQPCIQHKAARCSSSGHGRSCRGRCAGDGAPSPVPHRGSSGLQQPYRSRVRAYGMLLRGERVAARAGARRVCGSTARGALRAVPQQPEEDGELWLEPRPVYGCHSRSRGQESSPGLAGAVRLGGAKRRQSSSLTTTAHQLTSCALNSHSVYFIPGYEVTDSVALQMPLWMQRAGLRGEPENEAIARAERDGDGDVGQVRRALATPPTAWHGFLPVIAQLSAAARRA
jgi:hypothetical protein